MKSVCEVAWLTLNIGFLLEHFSHLRFFSYTLHSHCPGSTFNHLSLSLTHITHLLKRFFICTWNCFWVECKPANPVLSLCQPAPCVQQGCAQARACHSGQSRSAGSGASVEEGSPARPALSPSQPPSPSACSPPSLP